MGGLEGLHGVMVGVLWDRGVEEWFVYRIVRGQVSTWKYAVVHL